MAEGIGISATYEVYGNIYVRKQSENLWSSQIVAQASAHSKGYGDVTFSAMAYMYVDGSITDKKSLSNNGVQLSINQLRCNLGTCSFVLPQQGKAEIELEVSYLLVTATGAAGANNFIADVAYKINKTLGKWLGKIRERIN
ncbi:MAG: hypothetical protein PHD21_03420 [Flavobacteriales bacterium]|nr:hypothetical protein [Flavobacteriales bacterium]